MKPHTTLATREKKSERAPRSASVVGSARACVACGTALTGRPHQQCCSARCRAALSRREKVRLPVAEARAIQARLRMALEALAEANATLERYGR
jgi:predicted nucleic acid-binding Zn ribbon protein